MTGMDGYRNETQKISQLTLALMEDSGWYVPRWAQRRAALLPAKPAGPSTSRSPARRLPSDQALEPPATLSALPRYEYTMNLTMGYQAGCSFYSSTSSGFIASNPSQVS
jgi:hypothetical protein